MGIEVLDHVILADTRYCSFKEMGAPVGNVPRRSDRLAALLPR